MTTALLEPDTGIKSGTDFSNIMSDGGSGGNRGILMSGGDQQPETDYAPVSHRGFCY